jgi:hypothetical protein
VPWRRRAIIFGVAFADDADRQVTEAIARDESISSDRE